MKTPPPSGPWATHDLATERELFFGLRTRPFSLTPDPRFTFHSQSHTQALGQVTGALQRREGLIVVTGAVGVGKTMLCRTMLETFESRTFLSVILDPGLTVGDLLRQVLVEFGLLEPVRVPILEPFTEVTRHQLVSTLQRFLASLIPLNAHAVIMIDEAQHLSPEVLEEIRLLSNFETDSAKLLQIVLVGQPELARVLERPELQQLSQRVARRCELHPLSPDEVHEYIERRLAVAAGIGDDEATGRPAGDRTTPADARYVQFTSEATQAIAAISGGLPRVVNTLCDRALEVGYEQKVGAIDRPAVLEAASRLQVPVPSALRLSRVKAALAAAAVIAVLATIGLAWPRARPVATPAPAPVAATPAASPSPAAVRAPEPAKSPDASPEPGAASTPAAARTTARAVAPSGATSYAVLVASFKTAQRASDAADVLTGKGHPASMRPDAGGQWFLVVVGPYVSNEEAAEAQQLLGTQGYKGTRVISDAGR